MDPWMDARAQARLVRDGDAKPAELVEATLERIERLNPRLNAVISDLGDRALDAARDDLPDGPFRGVPYLLKDLGDGEMAGVPFTEGSRLLRGFVPDEDSHLVARLKSAGFVIVGKTNTPEFGILPTTEPELHGPTRNPWDPSRTPGGSSGGSAAAVASGMVPAAHGNDGGGSIRIPASCCGLFGLKPTRGRNPLGPHFGDVYSGLVSGHALTRTVGDSAAILDVTAGPAPGDPYRAPPASRPFAEEVGADPGRLRIGVLLDAPTGLPVDPVCVDAVRSAAALCIELGHDAEDLDLDLGPDDVADAFVTVWTSGVAWVLKHWRRRLGRDVRQQHVEALTWAMAETGRSYGADDYLVAIETLQRISRRVAALHERYDVILTPTLAEPPVPLGSFDPDGRDPLSGFLRAAMFVPFTPIANITGQPAMSVPLHRTADGLPVGVHALAPFGDEATLFRLAGQLEAARPWADARPPISA